MSYLIYQTKAIKSLQQIIEDNKLEKTYIGALLTFETQETINYLKQNATEVIMPSHCTALPALSAFFNEFGGEQVKAGTLYTFEN